MWKKITSFFFDEEEIEIEPSKGKEDYEIPVLKPYTPSKKETPIQKTTETRVEHKHKDIVFDSPKPSVTDTSRPVTPTPTIEETPKRRSFGIDLEDQPTHIARKDTTVIKKPNVEDGYSIKEVISPMYGGPQSNQQATANAKVELKSRRPITPIISPIYGKINESEGGPNEDRNLLDMKLDEIIRPENKVEEQQTSLYDYLEGLNEDE